MTKTTQSLKGQSKHIPPYPGLQNFEGTFSSFIRNALKNKRLELGASYQQLGQIMGLHWSTLRKWEEGDTVGCHGRHISRIRHFLNGDYDMKIKMLVEKPSDILGLWNTMSPQMHECMEHAAKVYGLCSAKPEVGAQLIDSLNTAINDTIRLLLSGCGALEQK